MNQNEGSPCWVSFARLDTPMSRGVVAVGCAGQSGGSTFITTGAAFSATCRANHGGDQIRLTRKQHIMPLDGARIVLLSFIFFARRDDFVQPARCQGAQPTVACLIQKLNAESWPLKACAQRIAGRTRPSAPPGRSR